MVLVFRRFFLFLVLSSSFDEDRFLLVNPHMFGNLIPISVLGVCWFVKIWKNLILCIIWILKWFIRPTRVIAKNQIMIAYIFFIELFVLIFQQLVTLLSYQINLCLTFSEECFMFMKEHYIGVDCFVVPLEFLCLPSGMDRCEINISSDVKRNYVQNVTKTFNAPVCLFKASIILDISIHPCTTIHLFPFI